MTQKVLSPHLLSRSKNVVFNKCMLALVPLFFTANGRLIGFNVDCFRNLQGISSNSRSQQEV